MKLFYVLSFIFTTVFVNAQQDFNKQGSRELGFISYLINSQQYDEAIFHINQLPLNQFTSPGLADSISYLKAWAFYGLKQLDSSAIWFRRIGPEFARYKSALFFASSDYIFLKRPERVREILSMVPATDSLDLEARNLQYAGLSLLDRDYNSYQKYSSNFIYRHYAFANEEIVLDDCYRSMRAHNDKSFLLAGIMSSIIPGSGKIYAGKPGEGISSFLLISFLAAITVENYVKTGPWNFKTIGFGSLFTIFYIGNIYGSVISIKVVREEFYQKYDNTILLHIHLPLRTLYGR
jgi:TM2 domain-containing membrane protein YozV